MALMACLVLMLVVRASSSLTNADTYFHLRIGAHFLHDWVPWSPGHLNRFATADWVPTQWLSEVIMAALNVRLGLAGVAWAFGALYIAFALTVYRVVRARGSALVASVVTVFATIACSPSLVARPQVVSYILTAITVHVWLKTEQDQKPRWWLVPMGWLWSMLHGMWLLGVVTSLVMATAVVVQCGLQRCGRLFVIPLGMFAAAGLTPAGPGLYRAVVLVGTRSSIFDEWKPPDYTTPSNAVLGLMLAATVALALRRGASTLPVTALVTLACAWGAYSERTVPIAAVTVAPLLASELSRFAESRSPLHHESRWLTGIAAIGVAVLGYTSSFAAQTHQPRWVDPSLRAMPVGTAIIADWVPAGYLTWAYPNLAPVMTGYADMYTDGQLHKFVDITSVAPGWDHQVASYGAHVALLDPHLSLAYGLEHSLHWKVVHRSPDVELLRGPSPGDG